MTSVAPEPARPYWLYAMVQGSGPVVVGTYATELELRKAYTAAKNRLASGSYYSSDVKDFAVGEDPSFRQSGGAGSAERPGNWAAAIEQLALL